MLKRVFHNSLVGCIAIVAMVLVACGEDSASKTVVNAENGGMEVVSDIAMLPPCSSTNEKEMVWVKNEAAPRMCSGGKWYAIAEGSGLATCFTEPLADGSGMKLICRGDSVGVFLNGLNGKDGLPGAQGEKGDKGDKGDIGKAGASPAGKNGKDGADGEDGVDGYPGIDGADGLDGKDGDNGADGKDGEDGKDGKDGVGCSIENVDELVVRVICGSDTAVLYAGEVPDSVAALALDSEKVAVSLDEVSGLTQKGPFVSGSNVLVREMEDGRTLTQTGNSFNGKILNDKGEFKINGRMLVSQYVMLEASGYYRNEVTGEKSKSPLTLFAITDVNDRNTVNVNLLTHLEYERVVYLVTQKKMKVKAAKRQAQKEVFNLLHIDATGFSNSEDLNIAGGSDEDGALLAFSILLQGDRSVSELSELLTKIATDMEEDGTWDDDETRHSIADWAARADSNGRFSTIRANVEKWGLSAKVPDFEKYMRQFWYTEYEFGKCNKDSVGSLKSAYYYGDWIEFICKDIDAPNETYRWVAANFLEKQTSQWEPGEDGEIRIGAIGDGYWKYVYDAELGQWRETTAFEDSLGACIESVEKDDSKNVRYFDCETFNGSYKKNRDCRFVEVLYGIRAEWGWYKCIDRKWTQTTALYADTRGWEPGDDGDVVKGDRSEAFYVYDAAEGAWREANEQDSTLGFGGCTTNRKGNKGQSAVDGKYYACSTNHLWTEMIKKVYDNTKDLDCDEEGKIVPGQLLVESYFVCDAGVWRDATAEEEQAGEVCTSALQGSFSKDSTKVCDKERFVYEIIYEFRDATIYDFPVGKDWTNPNVTYGVLVDKRDGRTYKTIEIGDLTIMAENLNYAGTRDDSYLIDNNWCYNNDSINCLKGGRLYTWTAAMNIDPKWQDGVAHDKPGLIGNPHRGICPEGWHIPTSKEKDYITHYITYDVQAQGVPLWPDATNASGLSLIPTGVWDWSGYFMYETFFAAFWYAGQENSSSVEIASYNSVSTSHYGWNKKYGMSVRCIKDAE